MNPLHPYQWAAVYHDGRRIERSSPGGPWTEAALPAAGIKRLLVWGPAGTFGVEAGAGETPTSVCLRFRGTVTLGPRPKHTGRWMFGFQHGGDQVRGVRINSAGRASTYAGPMAGW